MLPWQAFIFIFNIQFVYLQALNACQLKRNLLNDHALITSWCGPVYLLACFKKCNQHFLIVNSYSRHVMK